MTDYYVGMLRKKKALAPSKPQVRLAPQREILEFFQNQKEAGKTVVTFVGYSGTGYEDPKHMKKCVRDVLRRFDPDATIINIGVTPDGIGVAYEIAKKKGFITTGIVSQQAMAYGEEAVSPYVDVGFYVRDKVWGGYLEDGRRLSPTSRVMVRVSDHMVAIGGGSVSRDELLEAKRTIPVEFFAADMNHQKAKEKAKAKGQPKPTRASLRGAVHEIAKELRA